MGVEDGVVVVDGKVALRLGKDTGVVSVGGIDSHLIIIMMVTLYVEVRKVVAAQVNIIGYFRGSRFICINAFDGKV